MIKYLITDVDGTLTNSQVAYNLSGETLKHFSTKDGHGLAKMRSRGVKIVLITSNFAGQSIVQRRGQTVGADKTFCTKDKLTTITNYLNEEGSNFNEVLYCGDDENDIPLMKQCLSACPFDAHESVFSHCDYASTKKGGEGAIREIIDWYLDGHTDYEPAKLSDIYWNDITGFENKGKGEKAIIVGTGPSANNANFIKTNNITSIAINRAICIRNDFDFLFLDSPETITEIEPYINNVGFIILPITSRGKLNINHPMAKKYSNKICLYCWSYLDYELLKSTPRSDYPLSKFQLFISWGCSHSAMHFCKLLGVSSIQFFGCDGAKPSEDLFAKKVLQCFPSLKKINKKKRIDQYKKSNDELKKISELINIPIV